MFGTVEATNESVPVVVVNSNCVAQTWYQGAVSRVGDVDPLYACPVSVHEVWHCRVCGRGDGCN